MRSGDISWATTGCLLLLLLSDRAAQAWQVEEDEGSIKLCNYKVLPNSMYFFLKSFSGYRDTICYFQPFKGEQFISICQVSNCFTSQSLLEILILSIFRGRLRIISPEATGLFAANTCETAYLCLCFYSSQVVVPWKLYLFLSSQSVVSYFLLRGWFSQWRLKPEGRERLRYGHHRRMISYSTAQLGIVSPVSEPSSNMHQSKTLFFICFVTQ